MLTTSGPSSFLVLPRIIPHYMAHPLLSTAVAHWLRPLGCQPSSRHCTIMYYPHSRCQAFHATSHVRGQRGGPGEGRVTAARVPLLRTCGWPKPHGGSGHFHVKIYAKL
jgi:hypothetical protein